LVERDIPAVACIALLHLGLYTASSGLSLKEFAHRFDLIAAGK
jgi:hypothetical protein